MCARRGTPDGITLLRTRMSARRGKVVRSNVWPVQTGNRRPATVPPFPAGQRSRGANYLRIPLGKTLCFLRVSALKQPPARGHSCPQQGPPSPPGVRTSRNSRRHHAAADRNVQCQILLTSPRGWIRSSAWRANSIRLVCGTAENRASGGACSPRGLKSQSQARFRLLVRLCRTGWFPQGFS